MKRAARDLGLVLLLVVVSAFLGKSKPGHVEAPSPPLAEPVWSVDRVALDMPLSQVAPLFEPAGIGSVTTKVCEFYSSEEWCRTRVNFHRGVVAQVLGTRLYRNGSEVPLSLDRLQRWLHSNPREVVEGPGRVFACFDQAQICVGINSDLRVESVMLGSTDTSLLSQYSFGNGWVLP